ncbi:MAG: glycosyltransferase family 2 protein [Ferruginibacter sp.]|nr:glycosyltransferase [Ferruginibacter sp.]
MKISLITVTFNAEKFLSHCIESVQNQTYKNIEHIIIDGNSTDNTVSIIKQFQSKIATWISEPDRGMYDAINKGINLATGDVIGILNSDDMLASANAIEEIVKTFNEQQVDSVYGDLEYVDQQNSDRVFRAWKGKTYNRNLFRMGWMPGHPTFYIKKSAIDKFGGYENHYYTAADYEFMARYLYKHKISSYYLPQLIVKMRTGGASNVNFKQRIRANRRDYLAMKVNSIPMPFLVSVLKPLIKMHQFNIGVNIGIF